MRSSTISRPALLLSVACVAGLAFASGCSNDSDAPAQFNHEESVAAATNFNEGGECKDNEDVSVQASDATITITGKCGNVHVAGTNLTVSVAQAKALAVRGENNTVSGDVWGPTSIEGVNISAESTSVQDLVVSGKQTSMKTTKSTSLSITGEENVVDTGSTESVVVNGVGNTVTATNVSKLVEATGSQNTISWTEGVEQAAKNEGVDNNFNR